MLDRGAFAKRANSRAKAVPQASNAAVQHRQGLLRIRLEQLAYAAGLPRLDPSEVPIRRHCRDPAPRRPLQHALLDQIRLDDVFQRVALLADGRRQVVDADRPARRTCR